MQSNTPQKVTGTIHRGGAHILQFTPLEDFYSKELRTNYIAGQKYTLRATKYCEPLRRMLFHWEKEGKVEVHGAIPAESLYPNYDEEDGRVLDYWED